MTTARSAKNSATRLAIIARPGKRTSAILGYDGIRLSVDLAAPPTDNQANEELIRVLAKSLDITKERITISRGHTTRSKVIRIEIAPGALAIWLSLWSPTKATTEVH